MIRVSMLIWSSSMRFFAHIPIYLSIIRYVFNCFIVFPGHIFSLIASSCKINSDIFQSFVRELPTNISMARKLVGGNRDNFDKYKCCPSCFSIYPWKGTSNLQELCTHVEFPDHPQHWNRKVCGEQLMKPIRTPTQNLLCYPRLIYCYKSVVQSLKEFLIRPNFIEKCELWRRRHREGVYTDVYDGRVWKDFLEYQGKPFRSLPFNFGLHLNVDWFQPFKHTQHAEGAIYLTIFNLPREERYLQENTILLGIIPGPKEPTKVINSFLQPFIKELLSLWRGVVMSTAQGLQVLVRAAILCCGCDVPAARKVCGFKSCSAYMGCSKCLAISNSSVWRKS